MENIIENISKFLTADYMALLSVIITVLIFIASKQSELKYKKHDDKKIQYIKLIELLASIFTGSKKGKKGELQITEEMKKKFFDIGSSLLLYGSKELYNQYLFFREFSTNPLIPKCRYYQEDLIIYIMADILTTIRKEVGLSNFNSIPSNKALGFFVNDISNNPIAKANAYNAKYKIKMIKLELSMIDRVKFIWAKRLYYKLLKPIGGFVIIAWKYFFIIPFGRLLIYLFPKFAEKIVNKDVDNTT